MIWYDIILYYIISYFIILYYICIIFTYCIYVQMMTPMCFFFRVERLNPQNWRQGKLPIFEVESSRSDDFRKMFTSLNPWNHLYPHICGFNHPKSPFLHISVGWLPCISHPNRPENPSPNQCSEARPGDLPFAGGTQGRGAISDAFLRRSSFYMSHPWPSIV